MKNILGYAFSAFNDAPVRVGGILRELARSPDVQVHLLTNHLPPKDIEEQPINWIQSPLSGQIISLKLRDLMEKLRPALFIVDAYPLGAENELEPILKEAMCPAIFLQRHIPVRDPEKDLQISRIVETYYDLTIAARDVIPYKAWGRALYTEPLTYALNHEAIDEVDARLALNHTGRPLILFGHNVPGGMRLYDGLKKSCQSMDGLRFEWRLLHSEEGGSLAPENETLTDVSFARWKAALHAVVLPADYASIFEAQQSGIPALFVPAKDERDDQKRRAGPAAVLKAEDLLKRIRGGQLPEAKVGMRYNGVAVAARAAREIMGRRIAGLRLS